MQTFSAKKNNRATMIRPYELALYCVQGYDIWQETPEEKRLARPGHPVLIKHIGGYPGNYDLETVALEDTAHTMKLGG